MIGKNRTYTVICESLEGELMRIPKFIFQNRIINDPINKLVFDKITV